MNASRWKQVSGLLLVAAGAWAAHAKSVSQGTVSSPVFDHMFVKPLYAHSLTIYFLILVVALLVGAYAVYLSSVRKKQHLKALLDSMVGTVMRTPQQFGDQEYRITLFKFRKLSVVGPWQYWTRRKEFRSPIAGWLIGYVRSGEEKLSGCTVFAAPIVSNQSSSALHGVAGAAWVRGRDTVDNLPVINDISPEPDKARYSDATHLTMNELQQRLQQGKSLAPSIWAERIELSRRKRWGVLVYDSIDPQPIILPDQESGHKLGLQALSLVIEDKAS